MRGRPRQGDIIEQHANLIKIWSIVISRIENGESVEDWAASDNLQLTRQLGPWRLLLLGPAWVRARTAYRASPTPPKQR